MSTTANLTTLISILRDAQRFVEDSGVQPQLFTLPTMTPRVCLPDPPSLYPHLIASGAEEKIANGMNRIYNARALELRSHYESSVSNVLAAVTHLSCPRHIKEQILDTFRSLYLNSIKSWIEEVVYAYRNRRKRVEQVANNAELSQNTTPRRTFNTDYIPLLERFFDENQFPTQADKVFLAQKSGMTYRQIHVWFQNRRNRLKKPNGSCRKRPAREGATLPLDHLRSRIEKHIVCEEQSAFIAFQPSSSHLNERKSCRESRSSETVTHRTTPRANDVNVLDKFTAPLHAFPSRYPPVYSYEPFSLESRTRLFSECSWRRRPNHDTSSQLPKIDVHDLADRFALLSVRDINSQSPTNNNGLLRDTLSATHSITIIPPPAPHPALIKSREPVLFLTRWPQFPIVRVSQPASLVFAESTTSSIRTLPRSLSENSSRKISPLPRRYPHRTLLSCRNVTPPTSDSSSRSSSRSLTDLFDFEKETSSPVSCPGLLTPLWSPQPVTCPTP
ncbi:hypothetical protein JVU11DRAFT_4825 [Chiua virens]|nr:hypothetical protein JVU11DRAFT_4825 [Chiua virens]